MRLALGVGGVNAVDARIPANDRRRAVKRRKRIHKAFGFNQLAKLWIGSKCAPSMRVEEVDVNSRLMIALLISGVLVISASAQTNRSPNGTNSVMARLDVPQPSSMAIRAKQTPVLPGSRDAEASPHGSSDNGEATIVVDVWSTANQADPDKLSRGFEVAALSAATRIQFTQRRVTNSIKMGFPLGGGFWIQTDLDAIDDSLRMAALAATNEADRESLQQLQSETNRLREWCDWLIDQNRNLRLANYFISPATLDNDERYQNTVACNNFLMSMLASGRLKEEDHSCR
jgi:hypothetical protein